MDSDESGACTLGLGTTYLYPTNTWEVGMRGYGLVVERRGSLFWGSHSNFFVEKCLARMASNSKEVNMNWNH